VQGIAADAAEGKVIAGVAIRPMREELGPQFERATGHMLAMDDIARYAKVIKAAGIQMTD